MMEAFGFRKKRDFPIQELRPASRFDWSDVSEERIADIEVDRQVRWGANYKNTFWPGLLRLARKGLEAERIEGKLIAGEGAQKTHSPDV
jgi:hypothetical protein